MVMDDRVSFMDVRNATPTMPTTPSAGLSPTPSSGMEYHTGLLTVDGYIEQENAKAVETLDGGFPCQEGWRTPVGPDPRMQSAIFANRFDGGQHLRG